jgi:hypothetical protein
MTQIVGSESALKHIGRQVANKGTAVSPYTAWVACSPQTKGEISFVCTDLIIIRRHGCSVHRLLANCM